MTSKNRPQKTHKLGNKQIPLIDLTSSSYTDFEEEKWLEEESRQVIFLPGLSLTATLIPNTNQAIQQKFEELSIYPLFSILFVSNYFIICCQEEVVAFYARNVGLASFLTILSKSEIISYSSRINNIKINNIKQDGNLETRYISYMNEITHKPNFIDINKHPVAGCQPGKTSVTDVLTIMIRPVIIYQFYVQSQLQPLPIVSIADNQESKAQPQEPSISLLPNRTQYKKNETVTNFQPMLLPNKINTKKTEIKQPIQSPLASEFMPIPPSNAQTPAHRSASASDNLNQISDIGYPLKNSKQKKSSFVWTPDDVKPKGSTPEPSGNQSDLKGNVSKTQSESDKKNTKQSVKQKQESPKVDKTKNQENQKSEKSKNDNQSPSKADRTKNETPKNEKQKAKVDKPTQDKQKIEPPKIDKLVFKEAITQTEEIGHEEDDTDYCDFIASTINGSNLQLRDQVQVTKISPIETQMIQQKENNEIDAAFWRQLDMLEALLRANNQISTDNDKFICNMCQKNCKSSSKLLQHCWDNHKEITTQFD